MIAHHDATDIAITMTLSCCDLACHHVNYDLTFDHSQIQNEVLSESCKSACDLQISSIHNFLISIGLPMYQRPLTEGGVGTLEQLLKLKDAEIEQITGADSRHLRRIAHALEWVQLKLGSPGQGGRICS